MGLQESSRINQQHKNNSRKVTKISQLEAPSKDQQTITYNKKIDQNWCDKRAYNTSLHVQELVFKDFHTMKLNQIHQDQMDKFTSKMN